jgi:hypothetical protein
LTGVVDPCEINIESCLDHAEDDGDSIRRVGIIRIKLTPYPVQDVESSVRAKGKEVV